MNKIPSEQNLNFALYLLFIRFPVKPYFCALLGSKVLNVKSLVTFFWIEQTQIGQWIWIQKAKLSLETYFAWNWLTFSSFHNESLANFFLIFAGFYMKTVFSDGIEKRYYARQLS